MLAQCSFQNGTKRINTEGKNSVDIQLYAIILQKETNFKNSGKQHDNGIPKTPSQQARGMKSILVEIQHVFNTINGLFVTLYLYVTQCSNFR